jgi:hypothetical protein
VWVSPSRLQWGNDTVEVWLGLLVMELVEELEKVLVGSGRWGACLSGFGVRCLALQVPMGTGAMFGKFGDSVPAA